MQKKEPKLRFQESGLLLDIFNRSVHRKESIEIRIHSFMIDTRHLYMVTLFPPKKANHSGSEKETLIKWYTKIMAKVPDNQPTTLDTIKDAKSLCSIAFLEVVRQLSSVDGDRACILLFLWRRYMQIFSKVLQYFHKEKSNVQRPTLGRLFDEDPTSASHTADKIPHEFLQFKESFLRCEETYDMLLKTLKQKAQMSEKGTQMEDEVQQADKSKLLEIMLQSVTTDPRYLAAKQEMARKSQDPHDSYEDEQVAEPEALREIEELSTFSRVRTLASDILVMMNKRQKQKPNDSAESPTKDSDIEDNVDPLLKMLDSHYNDLRGSRKVDKFVQTDRMLDGRSQGGTMSLDLYRLPSSRSSLSLLDTEKESQDMSRQMNNLVREKAALGEKLNDYKKLCDNLLAENAESKQTLRKIKEWLPKDSSYSDIEKIVAENSRLVAQLTRLEADAKTLSKEVEYLREDKKVYDLLRRSRSQNSNIFLADEGQNQGIFARIQEEETYSAPKSRSQNTRGESLPPPAPAPLPPLQSMEDVVQAVIDVKQQARAYQDRSKAVQAYIFTMDAFTQDNLDDVRRAVSSTTIGSRISGPIKMSSSASLIHEAEVQEGITTLFDPRHHALDATWLDSRLTWISNILVSHRNVPNSVQSLSAVMQLAGICRMVKQHVEKYLEIPDHIQADSRRSTITAKGQSLALVNLLELDSPSNSRLQALESRYKQQLGLISPFRFPDTGEIWENIPGTIEFKPTAVQETVRRQSIAAANFKSTALLVPAGESQAMVLKSDPPPTLEPHSIQNPASLLRTLDENAEFQQPAGQTSGLKTHANNTLRNRAQVRPSPIDTGMAAASPPNSQCSSPNGFEGQYEMEERINPVYRLDPAYTQSNSFLQPLSVVKIDQDSPLRALNDTLENELSMMKTGDTSSSKSMNSSQMLMSEPFSRSSQGRRKSRAKAKRRSTPKVSPRPTEVLAELNRLLKDDKALPAVFTAGLASLGRMMMVRSYSRGNKYPWAHWPKHDLGGINVALSRLSTIRLLPTTPSPPPNAAGQHVEPVPIRSGEQVVDLPSVLSLDHLRLKVYERIARYIRHSTRSAAPLPQDNIGAPSTLPAPVQAEHLNQVVRQSSSNANDFCVVGSQVKSFPRSRAQTPSTAGTVSTRSRDALGQTTRNLDYDSHLQTSQMQAQSQGMDQHRSGDEDDQWTTDESETDS
eukprot:TRINITY_DN3252_c0_g1_i11.p1 TRINITY_DN3252_c0_g1~~TRINITY_DN3252_c0_g1_i11.p1  ORF type:complete len:1196 (+),score=227.37 TRINITY_DN3252_c0_g1_i11:52-3639(+)